MGMGFKDENGFLNLGLALRKVKINISKDICNSHVDSKMLCWYSTTFYGLPFAIALCCFLLELHEPDNVCY